MHKKFSDLFLGLKILISRRFLKCTLPDFKIYQKPFINKIGLEIGGPTNLFKKHGALPIYSLVKRLDGCNFSNNTIWEGNIKPGKNYHYGNSQIGYQYISEASDLSQIPSKKYDVVIASHVLEHIANPLKAVSEWLRLLKRNGLILLILPAHQYTFDHRRQPTRFGHLMNDFASNTGENDLTHAKEVLTFHNSFLDGSTKNLQYFKKRCLDNFKNRCLHHHVFDINLIKKIFKLFNIKIIIIDIIKPYHLVAIGKHE